MTRLRRDLSCVDGDAKPYSLTHFVNSRHIRAVTSRLLHSLEDILLRTVLFIILLSCLRSDIVILDTLIVLLTYLLTYSHFYTQKLSHRLLQDRHTFGDSTFNAFWFIVRKCRPMASGGKMDRRRRHLLANTGTVAPLGGSGENLSLGDIKQNTHIAILVKKNVELRLAYFSQKLDLLQQQSVQLMPLHQWICCVKIDEIYTSWAILTFEGYRKPQREKRGVHLYRPSFVKDLFINTYILLYRINNAQYEIGILHL